MVLLFYVMKFREKSNYIEKKPKLEQTKRDKNNFYALKKMFQSQKFNNSKWILENRNHENQQKKKC